MKNQVRRDWETFILNHIKLIMCNLQVSAVQAPMMHCKINFRTTQLVQACGHSLVFLAMAIAIVLQC